MIEARELSYNIGSITLLTDVSLTITPREVLAVVGPNGAGKSTLRKLLSGDLKPSSGKVFMDEKLLDDWTAIERARVRAVLPQDSSLNFPFTVQEVVLMGRTPHLRYTESPHDYEIADKALAAVDSFSLKERLYSTLSGGERQRVQIARVLTQIWEAKTGEARYLLLDEPTSSLDLAHQHLTLRIVRRFAREGVGVMVILHDLNLAAHYADKIIMLKSGRVVGAGTPAEVLTESAIRHTFDTPVTVLEHPQIHHPIVLSTLIDD